jgi:hypothetical protein
MPEGFSFKGDIAPMRGSFFKSGLSSREGSYLAKKYGPDMDDMKDMLTVQSRIASIRNSDLAYQSNLESLQQRREDAQKKRDQDARIGQISNNLIGITSGEGSPEDRAEGLANFRLENPELFNSPSANNLYSAATGKINAEKSRIAKEQAKIDRQINTMRPAIEAGNIEAVKSRAKALGLSEEDTAQRIAEAQSFKDSAIGTAAQIAAQKEIDKYGGQDLQKSKDRLKDLDSDLEGAYIDEDDYGSDPKMPAKARNTLVGHYAKFSGKRPDEVRSEGMTDKELRNAVEGYRDQLSIQLEAQEKAERSKQYNRAGYQNPAPTVAPQRESSLQTRTGL